MSPRSLLITREELGAADTVQSRVLDRGLGHGGPLVPSRQRSLIRYLVHPVFIIFGRTDSPHTSICDPFWTIGECAWLKDGDQEANPAPKAL